MTRIPAPHAASDSSVETTPSRWATLAVFFFFSLRAHSGVYPLPFLVAILDGMEWNGIGRDRIIMGWGWDGTGWVGRDEIRPKG